MGPHWVSSGSDHEEVQGVAHQPRAPPPSSITPNAVQPRSPRGTSPAPMQLRATVGLPGCLLDGRVGSPVVRRAPRLSAPPRMLWVGGTQHRRWAGH